jgi:hypothetical protein
VPPGPPVSVALNELREMIAARSTRRDTHSPKTTSEDRATSEGQIDGVQSS